MRYDAIVLGIGGMGSAATYHSARRGLRVLGIEQFTIPHEMGSPQVLPEGPEGFQGGLSASNYASITRASPATTTRDLGELVPQGALLRTGERRHARYRIAIARRPE